jgi:hypothetical protein
VNGNLDELSFPIHNVAPFANELKDGAFAFKEAEEPVGHR